MTGEDFVNHRQIEESNTVDLYLLGRLPPEEQTLFEEHFVDCQECLDRLETSANFRRAAKVAFAEDAARTSAYVHAGLFGWLIKRNRWQQTALLLGAIVVLVVLPISFFLSRTRRIQIELDQAKNEASKWQQQYLEQQRAASELEKQLQARTDPEPDQPSLPDKPRPQSRVPVFAMNIVRSADLNSSSPANQVAIPHLASSVILALELESDSDVQSYRATISTADNRVVWTAKDLKPQSNETLKIPLRSDILKPNDYQLVLEGLTKDGSYVPQSKYSFRVMDLQQYRAREPQ